MANQNWLRFVVPFADDQDILDLGLHYEEMERKHLQGNATWEDKTKFLVLCSPKSMQTTVDCEIEKFSEEFSMQQHDLFLRQHPEGDVFDNNHGGYLFTTPVRRLVTRVLDRRDRPDYTELKARVLRVVLGAEAEATLERRIDEGQGINRIEAYIAKFQRWMKVLDGLGNRWDERRYAKKFLKGLQESVKTRVIFDSEDLTLEGAYEASRVATSRASVLGAGMAPQQDRNKWQVHPSRAADLGSHQFHQANPPLRVATLFGDQTLCVGGEADPEVCAVIGSLNTMSTPFDYLKLVGSVGQVQLNEGSLLTASAQSLLPFHIGLKSALVNVRTLRQLQVTIPLILPEQYLHTKKNVGRQTPEKLNAMEDRDPIREQLKQMEGMLNELRGKQQKTELATVVEMLSEMRDGPRGKDSRYKRSREDSDRRDDFRGDDRGRDRKIQRQEGKEIQCYDCGERGHMRSDCKNPESAKIRRCIFCKDAGHTVDECPKRLSTVCRECQKKGHSAAFHRVRLCRKCNKEHSGLAGC